MPPRTTAPAATGNTDAEIVSIHERLDAGDQRMERIEGDLAANTKATQQVAANTQEMVAMFESFRGAFRVLEGLGKLAKPMASLLALGAAIAGLWASMKGIAK